MFNLALAQVVKERPPVAILREVVGDVLGKKDVPRIATIHHSLCDVDPSSGDVRLIVDVGNTVDRSAVDPHADLEAGTFLQFLADLDRTLHRIFRCAKKEQRHSISSRHTDEFLSCFGRAETITTADDFVQLAQPLDLLIYQQARVADNVEKEDVRDFEL